MNDQLESSESPTVYLHIGMSKTGTTAIQRFLHENAEALASIGIKYPTNHRNPSRGYHDWGHHILSHKWGGWLDPKVFPISPDDAWVRLAAEIQSSSDTFIISSERFQDLLIQPDYIEILEFIRDTVNPAKLKIVGYVRRQDTFAESHFKELVKNSFNRTSLDQYVDNLPAFYDYNSFFRRCSEVVGKENVIVRIFQNDRFVGGDIFNDFAQACGFELPPNALLGEKLTNVSLGSSCARIMSEHSVRSFWREPEFRSDMFNFFSQKNKSEVELKPLLGTKRRNEIMARFEDSNNQLIRDFLNASYSDVFNKVEELSNDEFSEQDIMFSVDDVVKLLSAAARSYQRSAQLHERATNDAIRILNAAKPYGETKK